MFVELFHHVKYGFCGDRAPVDLENAPIDVANG